MQPNRTPGPLAPGSYKSVTVLSNGVLPLATGTFKICRLHTAHGAVIEPLGPVTVDVSGDVVLGSGGKIEPAAGVPLPVFNVGGSKVCLNQGATAQAIFKAPHSLISFSRDSTL